MELRKALLPLYIVSKVFCTSPFSLKHLRPSLFGSIIAICQAIGYIVFHLWMVNRDLSAESPKNLVRQLIDSYNRYSGFCAFCVLVITSIRNQREIVTAIQNVEDIDKVFEQKLDTSVDNHLWRRNVLLQICFCIMAISFFEWRNCLMYIQDSVPFSEFCLIMCLVPLYVIGMIETQIFAYFQLIRYRLGLLNKILIHFGEIVNSKETERNSGFPLVDEVSQKKSNSFEYFVNKNRSFSLNNGFKNPNIYYTRTRYYNTNKFTSNSSMEDNNNSLHLNDFGNKIIQIQQIYSKLERTVAILRSAFSPYVIVILVMKFTTLTSLLYFCCMVIIRIISGERLNMENKEQLLSTWGWICALFLEIFILCYASSTIKDEYKKLGSNLHNLALNLNKIRWKMKVKALSMQLLFNGIEINPFGLFNLDLSFMYGLIGSVCTYLIILIQFDLAQKAQQINIGGTISMPNP